MMTHEEQLEIMQAFISGKDIEYRYDSKYGEGDRWDFVEEKHVFDFKHFEYRIAEEPREMSLYDKISSLNDFVRSDSAEMSELQKDMLADVIDYAEGCYCNHCEEVGRIATESIDEMRRNWLDTARTWFRKDAWSFRGSTSGMPSYDSDKAMQSFTDYMEKNMQ